MLMTKSNIGLSFAPDWFLMWHKFSTSIVEKVKQNQLKAILITFDNKLKIDMLTGRTNYQHQWKDRYTFKCSGPYKAHWKETDLKNTSQFCYKHTCTCRNCNLIHFCKQG